MKSPRVAFSLRFCILQAIKNWRRRRPGNEARMPSVTWNVCMLVSFPDSLVSFPDDFSLSGGKIQNEKSGMRDYRQSGYETVVPIIAAKCQ